MSFSCASLLERSSVLRIVKILCFSFYWTRVESVVFYKRIQIKMLENFYKQILFYLLKIRGYDNEYFINGEVQRSVKLERGCDSFILESWKQIRRSYLSRRSCIQKEFNLVVFALPSASEKAD